MAILMIVLRMLHVIGGVFWAGSTLMLASHVTPSVRATGDSGQKFMQQLAGRSSFSDWLAITAVLSFLSGWTMYFLQGWYKSYTTPTDLVLGAGAVLGSAAFLHGLFVQRKATMRMRALGQEIAAAGGPPSSEQAAEAGELSAKISRNGVLLAYMLGITVVLMGTFQYF